MSSTLSLAKQHEVADKNAAGTSESSAHRPDIDGLRGFGALLVLWFHFCETWKNSPYRGADLTNSTFFAVSGYVITLSVLNAKEKQMKEKQEFGFKNTIGFSIIFFCRRLQRLLVSQLFVTIVTVTIFCAVISPGPRLDAFMTTSRFSVIGAANLYFAYREEKTEYIHTGESDLSLSRNPLMQAWYLGVEEQLYLLYPWIFVLAHRCANSYHRLAPYAVYGALFFASIFGARIIDDQQRMEKGFFLLQYRAWEVLVGVITCHLLVYSKWTFASSTSASTRIEESQNPNVEMDSLLAANSQSSAVSPFGANINMRLIVVQIASISFVAWSLLLFFHPEQSFLATVVALAGTALFFVSGHGYHWKEIYEIASRSDAYTKGTMFLEEIPLLNYIYGLPLPSFIGRISYAMYLWHFPIAVICAEFKNGIQLYIGANDIVAFLFQFGIILWVSIVTHHFVENPYRYWRPKRWYLPALFVLLMIAVIEVGLYFINEHVLDTLIQYYLSTMTISLQPICSLPYMIGLNVIFLFIIILRNHNTSKKFHLKESFPLIFAVSLLLCSLGVALMSSKIVVEPLIVAKGMEYGNASSALIISHLQDSSSTLWDWRGGTHSFASYGCRCQADPNNPEPPPGATDPIDNESIPLCFDLKHWSKKPHFAYDDDDHDCATPKFGVYHNAEDIWKECLEPARINANTDGKESPTAFVFGDSTGQRLRVAVANAIGGEYSILSFALPGLDHFEYLSAMNAAENAISFPETIFTEINNNKTQLGSNVFLALDHANYFQRISEILDIHLKTGDIVFFTIPIPLEINGPPTTKEVDSFIKNSGRKYKPHILHLGHIIESRNATLVLTSGMYILPKKSTRVDFGWHQANKNPDFRWNKDKFLELKGIQESILAEVAAEEDAIILWPLFGQEACANNECTRWIPGTSETEPLFNFNHGTTLLDSAHLSHQGEAFLSPYLCSFLKENSLLDNIQVKPREHIIEVRLDKLHINMNELRDGDQYVHLVTQLPSQLRKSAMISIESIYKPLSHRNIIHHVSIYSCIHFPEQSPGLGIPFLDKSLLIRRTCETQVFLQGTEAPNQRFPAANGKQYGIMFDTEYIAIEFHFKYPSETTAIMGWTDEDNLAKGKEIKELRSSSSIFDSSGIRLEMISEAEAKESNFPLEYAALLTLGPRDSIMLDVPPGLASEKVTSVCPRECFSDHLDSIGKEAVEIVGVMNHAHLAATAVYGQVLDHEKQTLDIVAMDANWKERLKKSERIRVLDEPIQIGKDTSITITCDYNTTDRTEITYLGTSVQEEMCSLYVLVSPPLPDLNYCWHLSEKHTHNSCVARCGNLPPRKFKLKAGTFMNWPPSNPGSTKEREELGMHWPITPVCEGAE